VAAEGLDALAADRLGGGARSLVAKHFRRVDQQLGIAGAAVAKRIVALCESRVRQQPLG
jgi:hypothetical protein